MLTCTAILLVFLITTHALMLPAISLEENKGRPEQGVYLDDAERGSTASITSNDKAQQGEDNEEEGPEGKAGGESGQLVVPGADGEEKPEDLVITEPKDRADSRDQEKESSDQAGQKAAFANGVYSGKGDGYTVYLDLKEDMKIPADVKVAVEDIREDDDTGAAYRSYLSAARRTAAREGWGEIRSVRFIKVNLFSGDKEIRSNEELDVLIVPKEKDRVKKDEKVHVLAFKGSSAYLVEDLTVKMTGSRASAYRFCYSSIKGNRNWGLLGLAVTGPRTEDEDGEQTVKVSDKDEDLEAESDASTEAEAATETAATTETAGSTEMAASTEAATTETAASTEEKTAAEKLTFSGEDYQVIMTCDERAAIPEEAALQVREIKKGTEEYEKYLKEAIDSLETKNKEDSSARFFDIKIMNHDQEIQPKSKVSVQIIYDQPLALTESDKLEVVHFGDEKTEVIKDLHLETNKSEDVQSLSFDTDSFSVYGIVETRIEKNVLASDGHNYRITVSYESEAGIPDNADLEVSELTGSEYEDYLGRTSVAMNAGGFDYARIFDISILDSEGREVELAAPVAVTIELVDGDRSGQDYSVVHFQKTADTKEKTEEPMRMDADTKGNVVSFSTESFSAYAIVQGPESIPLGWKKIGNFDDLNTAAGTGGAGVYIGQTKGYYLMNSTVTNTNNPKVPSIGKTKPAQSVPGDSAAKYYFEAVEGSSNQFYIYCYDGNNKQYVITQEVENVTAQKMLVFSGSKAEADVFTVKIESDSRVRIFIDENGNSKPDGSEHCWNMANGDNGNVFATYNAPNDQHNYFYLWKYDEVTKEPYGLEGLSYGLMNWAGGVAGKAMMASSTGSTLDAKALTVMSKLDNSSQLFVPNDSDISMWTFHWISDDLYYLTTVADGSTRYLKIDSGGLSLVSSQDEASQIQVIPGTGSHKGQICLKSGNTTLTYSGTTAGGFSVGGSVGNEWLNLVELSELTTDYFLTYSAQKVSVSDENISNGSRVIVYTRSWNEDTLQYDYYAISSDGSLVPVYESGDSIEWVSGQINSLLWNFVEYYWEGTDDPNFYYELYNQYSEKYIAPQVVNNQILSDDTIGINLNGRRDGKYYSTILAWDEDYYSYVGLKVEDGRIVSCPKSEAMDFYFAVMQDLNIDDTLNTVNTVDHTQYGITMKIKDYKTTGRYNDQDTSKEQHDVLGTTKYATGKYNPGLLSTDLKENGYPTATATGNSVSQLFENATEVNHLFIESTYNASGYYVYDSTQNFAYLDGTDFTVYKELGTYDKNSIWGKHGQFLPFNNIEAGRFASVNPENLYTAEGVLLPDTDPRKYESLYVVKGSPNYYYGLELEASFTQTPSGLDAWGHDIIYEFTGDDDFWLYVDGELVIDLGGIHDAMPGSVNFRTGEVKVNKNSTTLYDLFYNNYLGRGHTEGEALEYVAGIFEQNSDGQWVFKDDTTHTMKIFYMERGAGAANLNMKFNLAAVKKGTVQLSKTLSGVDESNILAEFPYQIWYKKDDGTEHRLTNAIGGSSTQNDDYVYYKDTVNPVKYQQSLEVDGTTYQDVFFLKPGEAADISFPEGMTSYRIIECGVNTKVYNNVTVNGTSITGTEVAGSTSRKDYGIDYATTDYRTKVKYDNQVDPEALRTITIKKQLYEEDGVTEITDNATEFTFRLYLASEFDDLDVANMHTYHVKDPEGYYCRWNVAEQKFERIVGTDGKGFTNYSDMSNQQKGSASFPTSIYGSIGRIRTGYTVEVREVLADTKYRVEERPSEIPDGYSFQKYENYENEDSSGRPHAGLIDRNGVSGVNGIVVADADPHVDVRNLKGWGLRVNKIWSDADYMSERGPTYFAVYTKGNGNDEHGSGNAGSKLVEGTVRQLTYGADPQTVYWYFDRLADGKTIDDYLIREVTLTGNNWTVNEDGTVTIDSNHVHPVHEGGNVTLSGRQKGEISDSGFEYTVLYRTGETSSDSNVRVDTVTNNRPGLVLKKTQWDGTRPLEGAVFELKDNDGNLIGSFTSDEEGLITIAFLRDNVDYILTETNAPQGWHGLQSSMTINLNNKSVTVSGVEEDCYIVDNQTATPTLTIKNMPYNFQAIKKDGSTGDGMAGVKFALHRQVTVGDVTTFDPKPMPGYEELITDEEGIIPQLDHTLPPGTYELRETATLADYELLTSYIHFTISKTGAISLASCPDGVNLVESKSTGAEDGSIAYLLNIPNIKDKLVSIWKTDEGYSAIRTGAKFALYKAEDYDDNEEKPKAGKSALLTGTTGGNGLLSLGKLNVGDYRLVETREPEGYSAETSAIKISVRKDAVTAVQAGNNAEVTQSGNEHWVSGQDESTWQIRVWNNSGVELPSTGGPGSHMFTILGILLLAGSGALLWKKRRADR